MSLKKVIQLVLVGSVLLLFVTLPAWAKEDPMYFFYGKGCAHCVKVEEYFRENKIYDRYEIEEREVYYNGDNAILFNQLMEEQGIPQSRRGVPTLFVGAQAITGDRPIIEYFTTLENGAGVEPLTGVVSPLVIVSTAPETGGNPDGLDVTLLAVIGAALVDAVNPCEFAVLIILMSTILARSDHRKALWAGLAFSASIFISYLAMGLGFYQALSLGNVSGWFFGVIGWLAIILGLFNLKDWLWYGKGFLMEVPLSWRPKLKALLNSVTSPVGAFGIGFLVSLFLLPCTSGPYIVILGMLAERTIFLKAVLYLILYNLIFIAPMLLITCLVYKGLDPSKAESLRQKKLRVLHLIAGLLLIAMGVAVLLGWI